MDKHDRQRLRGAMNAFERAKDTYERNRIQQGRDYPKGCPQSEVPPPVAEAAPAPAPKPVVEVPKEKPKHKRTEAVFDVRVYLPDGEIVFILTKPEIYSNVPKSKVTQMELKKAVAKGLEGLLGALR